MQLLWPILACWYTQQKHKSDWKPTFKRSKSSLVVPWGYTEHHTINLRGCLLSLSLSKVLLCEEFLSSLAFFPPHPLLPDSFLYSSPLLCLVIFYRLLPFASSHISQQIWRKEEIKGGNAMEAGLYWHITPPLTNTPNTTTNEILVITVWIGKLD